jgi:hypothetical protein
LNLKPHPSVGGVDERHVCRRCCRSLPWTQFDAWLHDAKYDYTGGRTNSGLRWGEVLFLHPLCRLCRKQIQGEWLDHPLYSKSVDRYWSRMMPSLRGGARSRGIPFLLWKDDLLGMYLAQEGKCALTGVKMVLEPGVRKANRLKATVDRIDSGAAYSTDNIQIICHIVNVMKNDLAQDQFFKWCQRVLDYREQHADNLLKLVG